MNRYLTSILAAGILLAGLTGCSNSDEPEFPTEGAQAQIVTVASTGSEGTTFTYQAVDDSPLLTLTTKQYFTDATVKPGTRVYLQFVPENSDAENPSGPVRVLTFQKCLGQTITEAPNSNSSNWVSSPIFLKRVWRGGEYLNMDLILNVVDAPRRFSLVLDPATADSDYPELHVSFQTDFSQNMSRPAYASFNIGELWKKPDAQGLKIYYVGPQGAEECATIQKTASHLTPAE